jgi:hypothetical protein
MRNLSLSLLRGCTRRPGIRSTVVGLGQSDRPGPNHAQRQAVSGDEESSGRPARAAPPGCGAPALDRRHLHVTHLIQILFSFCCAMPSHSLSVGPVSLLLQCQSGLHSYMPQAFAAMRTFLNSSLIGQLVLETAITSCGRNHWP